MPTYEYLCKQCGERFERVQPFSARPLKTHPDCGGPVQKVFHPSGVVFKGSGFYATDGRPGSNGKKSESKAESTSATSDGGSASKSPAKKDAPAAAATAAD